MRFCELFDRIGSILVHATPTFDQVEMPAYSSLRGVGSPNVLFNQWRSMQHRLRRRLERQGMVPRRRPGRPPKYLAAQYNVVSQVISPEIMDSPACEEGPTEEDSRVPGSSAGGERGLKRARTEEKADREQASLRLQL